MARHDRPAGSLVVADGGAVVEGLRPLAAELVEAVALAVSGVVEILGILAGVEVGPALAVVVDPLAVGEQRAVQAVDGRQLAEGEEVDDGGGEVVGVEGAAGEVDDRSPREAPAAPPWLRWDWGRRRGCCRNVAQLPTAMVAAALPQTSAGDVERGVAADGAVDPAVLLRESPLRPPRCISPCTSPSPASRASSAW